MGDSTQQAEWGTWEGKGTPRLEPIWYQWKYILIYFGKRSLQYEIFLEGG